MFKLDAPVPGHSESILNPFSDSHLIGDVPQSRFKLYIHVYIMMYRLFKFENPFELRN